MVISWHCTHHDCPKTVVSINFPSDENALLPIVHLVDIGVQRMKD